MIKKRILVITDDGAVCRSIKERTENDSTDVCCVNAPSEVLDNFVKWEYCLAIIDFGLSGMDGLETLRIMRKIKQTPILVLTSYLSANDKVALFQAGANAYIEKPIDTTVCVAQATALIQLFGDSDNIPHKCHPIVFGAELIINPLYRQVVIDSTPVELTRTEFDLFFVWRSIRDKYGAEISYTAMCGVILLV